MIDPTIACAIIGSVTSIISGTAMVMVRLASGERRRRERISADERSHERAERAAEREACEARFIALSKEIQSVRSDYSGEMVAALRESSKAMTVSAIAQQEGTRVLDRVCRRLEGLPCAREAIERRSLRDSTPQASDAIVENTKRTHP